MHSYFQASYKKAAAETAPHTLTKIGLISINLELFVATTRSQALRKHLNVYFLKASIKQIANNKANIKAFE